MNAAFLTLPLLFGQTAEAPTYWQDIRPVLRKYCTVCHSEKNLKEPDVSAGLALDTLAAIRGAKNKDVLHAGKAEKSLLYALLTTKDVKRRMPLDARPLPDEAIALVKRWIDTGAQEGKQDLAKTVEPTPTKKSGIGRRLDVVFKTEAVPPPALVGKGKAGKLDLALKIGPLAPATAVVFSPDGKLLAAGSFGQVVVWDLEKAAPAKILTNVLGMVNDLRFDPSGKLLAVAGGQPSARGEVRLFRTSDWETVHVLRGHDDVVFSCEFRPGHDQLATAGFDHHVKLWDVRTGKELRTIGNHSDFVYALAFSPDGKRLASAGKDRIVQLNDVETGKSVFTFSGMNEDVMAVAFHPDGKSLVSSGFESTLWLWDPATGEKVRNQAGHGVAVHELAFSKDGSMLLSAGADRTLRVWDGEAKPRRTITVGSSVYACAFSPDGKRVAAGSFDGIVRVYEEKTGRLLLSLVGAAGEKEPQWLALTPEGYAAASSELTKSGRWRIGGRDLPAAAVWSALVRPETVARAARGDTVPAPKFDAK